MLLGIANRLTASKKLRHLFFLGAAFLAIIITGYHFGNWDQAVHIPYLAKFADPSLYPGDPFLEIRNEHFSYFWLFFQPFYLNGGLAESVFVIHFLSVYVTFWMVWELSNTLFKNALTNMLSVIIFIFPHLCLSGGMLVIEPYLVNRSFVLPFLLAAIILFLRKRYWIAFIILGLMYNLHALSVNFILGMMLFDSLLRFREIKWRNFLLGIILFIICALPVLIWRKEAPIDLSLRPGMLSIISRGMLQDFRLFSLNSLGFVGLISGVFSLFLYLIARKHKPPSPYNRSMDHFMILIGLVTAIYIITTYWLPVTLILQFQIIRICFYILIFAYLYFCNFLVRQYQTGEISLGFFWVELFALATFFLPLLPFIVWLLRKWMENGRRRHWLVTAGIAVIQLLVIIIGFGQGFWSPGFHITPPKTAWVEVQLWSKEHTPKQARFITPPDMFQAYVPEWRVFSERSTVASLPELMEVLFEPGYLPGWMQRFETIAPGAIAQFNGNVYESIKISGTAYYTLTSDALLQIAKDYHASYLVVEKPHLHNFPIAYENQQFVVYDLTSLVNDP